MFACWLTYDYFNIVSNIVNKKMTKNELFLATENAKIAEKRAKATDFEGKKGILATDYLAQRSRNQKFV